MNLTRWYWYKESDADFEWTSISTISNWLQFVAKLHEILVIASLGALGIKITKRRLVGSRIPLGLLTGPYRLGDIPYLLSSSFQSTLASSAFLPAIFIALATVLATVVSPSSAVLLVPELDWFPFPNGLSNWEPPIFYNLSVDETWPRVVSASLFNTTGEAGLDNCRDVGGWYAYWCPGAGFAELWNRMKAWESSSLSSLRSPFTFHDPTGRLRRHLSVSSPLEGRTSSNSYFQNGTMVFQVFYLDTVTFTTTVYMVPMVTIARLLAFNDAGDTDIARVRVPLGAKDMKKFRLTTSGKSRIYQPLVQTGCVLAEKDDLAQTDGKVAFNSTALNCFGDSHCQDMLKQAPDDYQSETWNTSEPGYAASFMVPKNLNSTPGPLLAVASLPYFNGSDVVQSAFACTIMAHWVPATITVSPGESDFLESNITDLNAFRNETDAPPVGPAIRILDDWIPFLSPRINTVLPNGTAGKTTQLNAPLSAWIVQSALSENASLEFIGPGSIIPGNKPETINALEFVQSFFGAVVTEALARISSSQRGYVVVSHNSTTVQVTDLAVVTTQDPSSRAYQKWLSQDGYKAGDIVYDWSNGTGIRRDLNGVHRLDVNLKTPQHLLAAFTQLVEFDIEAEKYGYSSGKPGPTMRFALSVMSIYVGILGLYFLHAMALPLFRHRAGSTVPTIDGWGDMQELFVLAWNSNPDFGIGGSNVKVASERWQTEIWIRGEASGRTHLTVEDEGMERIVKRRLHY